MSSVSKKTTSEPAELTPFQRECLALAGRAVLEAERDNTDYAEDAVMAILSAESEEKMWTADDQGPMGGRDLAGIQMYVQELQVTFSDKTDMQSTFRDPETGRGMFLWVTAIRYDNPKFNGIHKDIQAGDKFRWNTSAPRLMAKLLYLERENRLDQPVVIETTDIGAGQVVLKLRAVAPGTLQQASESPF